MGLLEQIAADVAAIKAHLASQPVQQVQQAAPVDPAAAQRAALEAQLAALNGGTATQTTQAADTSGLGALGGLGTVTHPTVTADQLMALIKPHLENGAIKDALSVAMKANGVNALPEAQPHQYGALYTAFEAVIKQHTAGGAGTATTQSASII